MLFAGSLAVKAFHGLFEGHAKNGKSVTQHPGSHLATYTVASALVTASLVDVLATLHATDAIVVTVASIPKPETQSLWNLQSLTWNLQPRTRKPKTQEHQR